MTPSRTVSALASALVALILVAGCAGGSEQAPQEPAQETPAPETPSAVPEFPGRTEAVTELEIDDVKVGTGAEAVPGKTVTVHYTGWLTDGTRFDSSHERGEPFTFSLGAGQVIPGWEQGVAGMKVGGTRILVIPPDMGYGEQGTGPIPPNATLVFQVDLLAVE